MTEPIAEILQDFQAAVDRATAEAMDRLRAIAAEGLTIYSGQAGGDLRLISIGAAGHHADLTDDRIRQLCREYPYSSSPGGFGYKRGGRWQVVDHNFRQYLAGVRPGTNGAQDAEQFHD